MLSLADEVGGDIEVIQLYTGSLGEPDSPFLYEIARAQARGAEGVAPEAGFELLRSIEGWRSKERELKPELVIAAVESVDDVLSDRGRPARGFPAPLLFAQHGADFYRDIQLDERLVDRIASPFMKTTG